MGPSDYERFTRHLVEWAERDDRVTGLVALGSMADETRRDEWSDHDFWLVTDRGAASELRDDPSWLPDPNRIVVHFRETEHGRSAVYDDGHLVEFAVFEDDELQVARANDYAVLVGDGTLVARLEAMAAVTQQEHTGRDPDGAHRFGNFVAQMVIGLTRYGRGEELSANHLIRGWAVRSLLSVLPGVSRTDRPELLDNLDPHRRFEFAFPEFGQQLNAAVERPVPELASVLVDIAEEHLVGVVPTATPAVIDAVRTLISRVEVATK